MLPGNTWNLEQGGWLLDQYGHRHIYRVANERGETWSGERSAELVSTSETRNPKPTVKVGFELRNPKPETRNRLWRLNFPRTDRNPKPETRNPRPESELIYLPQDRSKPETQNPKPKTRNRLWRLNFPRTDRNPKPETRNPKPTVKVGFELRNLKPETDSEDLTSPGPIANLI